MTTADLLLLYAYIKTEDSALRNVLYRNRLDVALNEMLVGESERSIHFKNLVNYYRLRPDNIFEDTLAHIIMHVTKYQPRNCESKPHTLLNSYVRTIVRGFWCDYSARMRHELNLLQL